MPDAPLTLLAPLSGVVVPLAHVPDAAFAGGVVGQGIAIDPVDGTVRAPVAGRVGAVHRAGHAVTLQVDGLELIVHVGIDTVRLGGVGFTPRVTAGDLVAAGDPLLDFDVDAVARAATALVTPVVVTTAGVSVELLAPPGAVVRAGRDELLRLAREAGARSSTALTADAAPRAAVGAA